jgi:RNA polymerase sigma factor (sigma-70 family)
VTRVVEGVGQTTIETLEEAYERGYWRFLRVAEAIVGDPETAHDVVQEAFARAIRGRRSFRGDVELGGWLWRIVVNTARNARRDRPPAHLPLHEVPERADNGRPPAGDVLALVAAMPERQRLVLFLRYFADLDYAGIAAVLGIRPGTVAATLNQAHAALRRRLEVSP